MTRSLALKLSCLAVLGVLIVATGVIVTRYDHTGTRACAEGDWAKPACAAGSNVLLVTIDTLRADRLGCYGHRAAQTPIIDSLAAGGVRFTDAVASAPLTLPSHVTIHTGLDIPHHGVRNNGEFHLAADRVTLAEILKDHGYDTAAFVAAFVLDGRYGLNQGFDVYDDHFKPNPRKPSWGAELERPASEVTDAALKWLTARAQSAKPFFLWVHYYDPHTEYEPPPEFARRVGGDLYDGEIAYVDSQLARIIRELDHRGWRKRTVIVLVADHGEGLGEHDEMTHGHLIYESTMHVPLILNAPTHIGAGYVVSDRVTGGLDVTPTVLDLLGITPDTKMDGLSLVSTAPDADRTIYIETMLPLLNHGWSALHGLRRHRDKYIDAPRPEYYDLVSDPKEAVNLFDEEPPALSALVDELEERYAAWEAMGVDSDARIAMDPEEMKALEALGYVNSPIADEDYGTRDPKDMMKVWQGLINARGLTERGDLEAALKLIDTIQVFPRDLFALERRADIYTKMGRHKEAEKILREMLAIKPTVATYIWLGQILVEQNRFDELEVILKQAEALEPDAGAVLVLRGDVAAKKGKFDDALRLYDDAIRMDPKRSTSMAMAHAAKVREFARQRQNAPREPRDSSRADDPPVPRDSSRADDPRGMNPAARGVESPWFTDITDTVGLSFTHHVGSVGTYYYPEIMGSGCALLDYDGDGDLDIYLINGAEHENGVVTPNAATRNQLFRCEPDGTYINVTDASGLGDTGFGMGVAVADVDGDDDLDVYLTNVGRNTFYRNNGDGTFTEATAAAGFDDRPLADWSCSATFLDYDRDGSPDLFVTNYLQYDPRKSCRDRAGAPDYCGPMAFAGVPDVLYHNNGDGTFADVTATAGIGAVRARGLGVVADDFDEDGSIDIFVANDGEANQLWINQGDGTFRDEALVLGVALNEMGQAEASMGIAVGDMDRDSHLDIFCTHLRNESNTLYQGAGANGFEDATAVAGLGATSMDYTGFGTALVDIDHDGALDVLVVNGRVKRGPLTSAQHLDDFWQHYAEPNRVFANDGHGRFAEICARVGPFCSTVDTSRGLAIGDIDRDGDLDFLVSNGAGRARLYRNDTPKRGHWLIVEACTPSRRTPSIGAAITVEAAGRRFRGTVRTNSSYLSAGDGRVHFGIGAATTVSSIAVTWPGGAREVFAGGGVDRYVRVQQGVGKAESRKSKAESRKSKAENRKSKAESRKSKAENRKSKAESRKSKAESRKSKAESRKSKAESRKSKVASGKQKAAPTLHSSVDARRVTFIPPMADLAGAQKPVAAKIRAMVASVQERPKSTGRWGMLGMLYLAHGFSEEAATCLKTAETLDTNDFRWPHLLSYALPESNLDAVIGTLERSLKLKPDFIAGHLRLAQFLLQRADRAGARAQYEAVIAVDADNPHALLGLGRLDDAAGDLESAVTHLERARTVEPSYKEVCAALGRVYHRMGRVQESERVAARAKALTARLIDADDPLVAAYQKLAVDAASLTRRGASLVRRGRVDEGLRLLRRAVETDPDTAVNHRALGAALTQAGDYDAGLKEIDRALTLDPDRPRILIDRGVTLNAAGRFDEATKCFARIIELDPLNTAAWYNLASVQAHRGELEMAIASLDRYISLNPGDPRAYRNLAVLYAALHKPDEAVAHYRKSLAYEPFAPETYLGLARLLVQQSKPAAAANALREGLTRLPKHPRLTAAITKLTKSAGPE